MNGMFGIEVSMGQCDARHATTPLGLIQSTSVTQGSPALARTRKSEATLGFGAESLWDSQEVTVGSRRDSTRVREGVSAPQFCAASDCQSNRAAGLD